MPVVKCLSGLAEVPPHSPKMPKNKSKEAYLVPAPKARLYRKVLIAKCLPGCAEGPYQGQPLSPRECFKKVLGTRLEGTFECKACLENADSGETTLEPQLLGRLTVGKATEFLGPFSLC